MCVCVRERKCGQLPSFTSIIIGFLCGLCVAFFFLLADLTPIQAARRNRNSVNVHLTDTKAIDWNIWWRDFRRTTPSSSRLLAEHENCFGLFAWSTIMVPWYNKREKDTRKRNKLNTRRQINIRRPFHVLLPRLLDEHGQQHTTFLDRIYRKRRSTPDEKTRTTTATGIKDNLRWYCFTHRFLRTAISHACIVYVFRWSILIAIAIPVCWWRTTRSSPQRNRNP